MKKIISALFAFAFLTSAFHSQSVSKPFVTSEGLSYKFRYLSDDELDLLPSLRADFKDFSDWKLDYTTSKEHDFRSLNEIYDYRLRNFSIVKDSSKNQWLHFTMQAEKDRVSPKGKYPYVKIADEKTWTLGSKGSISFKLNTAASDSENGYFFLQLNCRSPNKSVSIAHMGYKKGYIFFRTIPDSAVNNVDSQGYFKLCRYSFGTTMDVNISMEGNKITATLTDSKGKKYEASYTYPEFLVKDYECHYELCTTIEKFADSFAEVYIRDFECKVE